MKKLNDLRPPKKQCICCGNDIDVEDTPKYELGFCSRECEDDYSEFIVDYQLENF